jgi:hypothetical protein
MKDEEKLMNDWTSGINKDHLFSDQIRDDEAFTFEEPDIGLDKLTLDQGQTGKTTIDQSITGPIDNTKPKEIKSSGEPEILKLAKDVKSNVDSQSKNPVSFDEKQRLLSLISKYGVQTAREMYIKGIRDGKEESSR